MRTRSNAIVTLIKAEAGEVGEGAAAGEDEVEGWTVISNPCQAEIIPNNTISIGDLNARRFMGTRHKINTYLLEANMISRRQGGGPRRVSTTTRRRTTTPPTRATPTAKLPTGTPPRRPTTASPLNTPRTATTPAPRVCHRATADSPNRTPACLSSRSGPIIPSRCTRRNIRSNRSTHKISSNSREIL